MAPFGFSRCVGIELLRGLYEAALATRARLRGAARPDGAAGADADACDERALLAAVAAGAAPIELRCGSFLAAESAWWLDADVVYASSICLPDGAMAELAGRMKLVRPGTVVITLKMLPGGAAPEFEVVHAGWYRMSWGRTGVWILRRTKYVS